MNEAMTAGTDTISAKLSSTPFTHCHYTNLVKTAIMLKAVSIVTGSCCWPAQRCQPRRRSCLPRCASELLAEVPPVVALLPPQ
jgi:hypothetical protein